MVFYSYLVSLLAIGFLVLIHELGHFLFCKLFSIPVSRFNIGFGPVIFSKTMNKTEYGISIIPLGGFVEIDNENESIQKLSLWKSSCILLAGIISNLLFAYITIIGLVMYNQDIMNHDQLKLFYPQKCITIKDKENTKINLAYHYTLDFLSHIKPSQFTLKDTDKQEIIFENETFFNDHFTIESNIPAAIIKDTSNLSGLITTSILLVNNIIAYTMKSIISLFKKCETKKLSGILGIIQVMKNTFLNKNFIDFLIILVFISINLALFNLLPLPILDGGKLLLVIIAKLIRKPISEKFENILTYISILFFILLTLCSTYYDIIRIFFTK